METIRKIRLAARDGKKSIRQIAKDFNTARNTVRKVLRSDQTRFEYRRDAVHRPQLGPFVDVLIALLEHNQGLPTKQRRTAQSLYEALQSEGYRGAYDSVRPLEASRSRVETIMAHASDKDISLSSARV